MQSIVINCIFLILFVIVLLLWGVVIDKIKVVVVDKIHNCPKCLKEKHIQKFRWPPNLQQMVFPTRMWSNLITTTTTFILSITTPQRSRTITKRIKNIQLITIDCSKLGGQRNFWMCFSLRHFGQLCILSIPDAIKRI
jgi:hypothetical protein